jgi:hypothetical protein
VSGLDGESLASTHEMGVRAVGDALKKARGGMSQREAAAHWGVPVATWAALEQGERLGKNGKPRNFQPHTLHQFDEALGESTLDLYNGPDAGAERGDIIARLDEIEAVLHTELGWIADQIGVLVTSISGSPVPVRFAAAWARLDADQQRTITEIAAQLAERRA